MNKIRLPFMLFATLILMLACVSLAEAQATRTWVSGVGDDANPCSRTAPCKTFAGAISKTAAGGEIDCIDPGGFGAVTLTKAITIDGGGTFASILSAGTNGINVNAAAGDSIVVRNISINGAGTGINGINYIAGGNVTVENCQIAGVTGNLIHMNLTSSGNLFVRNTTLQKGSSGIFVKTTSGLARAVINDVQVQICTVGIDAQDNSNVTVRDTVVTSNLGATIGMRLVPTGASTGVIMIENCTISSANEGLRVTSGGGVVKAGVSNTVFSSNTTGSNAGGGSVTVTTFVNNKFFNNGLDTSGSFANKLQQ